MPRSSFVQSVPGMFDCTGGRKTGSAENVQSHCRPASYAVPFEQYGSTFRLDAATYTGASGHSDKIAQCKMSESVSEVTAVFRALETPEQKAQTQASVKGIIDKASLCPMKSLVDKASQDMSTCAKDVEVPQELPIAILPSPRTSHPQEVRQELAIRRFAGRENTVTSETSILSEMTVLTEELKDQVFKLQAEVSEQKDKFALLQKEVSELTSATAAGHTSSKVKGDVAPAEVREVSPRRGRLSQIFGRASELISRSPSRSISPRKKTELFLQADTKDIDDIQPSFYPSLLSPSRSNSPEKNRSPSRRIEARLAPKLLSNLTGLVDAQIQNLELRMVSMETSLEKFRQAAVPDGAVDGMCAADLEMLSGLNVVRSRPNDLQKLLDPTAEAVWDHPPCSVNMSSQPPAPPAPSCSAPAAKSRASGPQKSASTSSEQSKGKSSQEKGSSWKRFSPVSGLSRLRFRRAKGKV